MIGQGNQRTLNAREQEVVGHWKLQGDCRDYSGYGNHGINHGVDLDSGTFDGQGAYIEIPSSASLKLGTHDFTLSAWIYTEKDLDDAVGDIVDMYDPSLRRGLTLSVNSSVSGYQSQGADRHVYFGIDNAQLGDWQDCGRPNLTSCYVSNSMVVYKGKLYAATTDAKDEAGWCHVYCYEADQTWTDCGRVGTGRTTGVGPLIVHNGDLYAVTRTYDWTRVKTGNYDAGRVYRYDGDNRWQDCGQPSDNRTLNSGASYKGKLYVGGGPETWGVFVLDDDGQWKASQIFPKTGSRKCFPHAMGRYKGKLYAGFPSVYAFDGEKWTYAGVPSPPEETLQTHSFVVFQGSLCAGTWPSAKVARYLGEEAWQDLGRVGEDGTEVNSLVVYNGKLYGGSIPRAEVCRYDGDGQWTSLRRFYSPPNWQPVLPVGLGGNPTRQQVCDWTRVTSMTICGGKLFASIGSCTSAVVDTPADVRGSVYNIEAGKCASYDDELAPGWRYLAAVRDGNNLKLYIDGKRVATSTSFHPSDYDISTNQPLRIGAGQIDFFSGKISNVCLYRRALGDVEIERLSSNKG